MAKDSIVTVDGSTNSTFEAITRTAGDSNKQRLDTASNLMLEEAEVTTSNPLPMIITDQPGNVIDTTNSSTALLGGDAVFTGTFTDALLYNSITVTLKVAQNSALDGIKLEFSSDGTNVDALGEFEIDIAEETFRQFGFRITR